LLGFAHGEQTPKRDRLDNPMGRLGFRAQTNVQSGALPLPIFNTLAGKSASASGRVVQQHLHQQQSGKPGSRYHSGNEKLRPPLLLAVAQDLRPFMVMLKLAKRSHEAKSPVYV
jgi:hypothetical protein